MRAVELDLESGEVLIDTVHYQKRQLEPFETAPCTFWKKEGDDRTFFNVKMENWEQFISDSSITNANLGHALYLSSFMHYDNILYAQERNKIPLAADGVTELLKVSKRSAMKVIASLQEAGLLSAEIKEVGGKQYNCYKLNDTYFYRGAFNKKDGNYNHTAKAFNAVIQQLYLENNAATLAFIAKMLPFLDKQTNIICLNPNRDIDYDVLLHMKLDDAAKIAGISRQAAANIVNKAKYHGIWAFAKVITGKTVRYKLNPEISTRQAGVTAFADEVMFHSVEGSYTYS